MKKNAVCGLSPGQLLRFSAMAKCQSWVLNITFNVVKYCVYWQNVLENLHQMSGNNGAAFIHVGGGSKNRCFSETLFV